MLICRKRISTASRVLFIAETCAMNKYYSQWQHDPFYLLYTCSCCRDRITQSHSTLSCACSLYYTRQLGTNNTVLLSIWSIYKTYKAHIPQEALTKYKQTETACIKPQYYVNWLK